MYYLRVFFLNYWLDFFRYENSFTCLFNFKLVPMYTNWSNRFTFMFNFAYFSLFYSWTTRCTKMCCKSFLRHHFSNVDNACSPGFQQFAVEFYYIAGDLYLYSLPVINMLTTKTVNLIQMIWRSFEQPQTTCLNMMIMKLLVILE